MSELYQQWSVFFTNDPLLVLFFSGFLSATLLPGSSELSLYAALNLENSRLLSVIVIATLGNTLGGMTNYYFGLFLPNRTLKQNNMVNN